MNIQIDKKKLGKDIAISLVLYILPIALMLGFYTISGQQPWNTSLTTIAEQAKNDTSLLGWVTSVFQNMRSWGLTVLVLALGVLELTLGLYDEEEWTKNEKTLDIVCFVLPKLVVAPVTAYFSLKLLPYILTEVSSFASSGTFSLEVPSYAPFCTLHGHVHGVPSEYYLHLLFLTNLFNSHTGLFRSGFPCFVRSGH